jgi:formate hydrogenlyase subunit 3/multisubunit Na+/H+ antiporter MnhD subunit
MNAPSFVWLIGIPLIAAPLIYLSGHLGGDKGRTRIAQFVGLAALLATWVPFYYAVRELNLSGHTTWTLGSISLCLNGIGLLLAAVALGLGTMVVLFSGPYMSGESNQEKFYAMLVAMIGVMIGLGFTCDLFNLWIWFEAMAITPCWFCWQLVWCSPRQERSTWSRSKQPAAVLPLYLPPEHSL